MSFKITDCTNCELSLSVELLSFDHKQSESSIHLLSRVCKSWLPIEGAFDFLFCYIDL